MNREQFLELATKTALFIAMERARVLNVPEHSVLHWAFIHSDNKSRQLRMEKHVNNLL